MTGRQRAVLALVCAAAVSAVYGIQPVLETAGEELGLGQGALGWLVAAGQIGYLAGLVLLVPLGDLLDRRTLITVQLSLTAVGAAMVAAAPAAGIAIAGLALAGMFAVVVQTTVAYVAAVSPAGERGRNIGAVTSGVVLGILGVRVIAGALGELADWRLVYVVIAALCALLALACRCILDADVRRSPVRYGTLLSSPVLLVVGDRLLLSRGLVAFFLFASFGTLWSGLALPLAAAPWHLGTAEIGLFGFAGLAGASGAARAGRWADRGRAVSVTGGSLALLTASWWLIAQARSSLVLLIVGVIVLDFCVQAVHVSSQHLLTATRPDRSSSVVGAYMTFYSLGSALGAISTTWAYSVSGWSAASVLGAAYAALGLLIALATRRSTVPPPEVEQHGRQRKSAGRSRET